MSGHDGRHVLIYHDLPLYTAQQDPGRVVFLHVFLSFPPGTSRMPPFDELRITGGW